jgi:uncharacterized protein GlcG (DUF336 family)
MKFHSICLIGLLPLTLAATAAELATPATSAAAPAAAPAPQPAARGPSLALAIEAAQKALETCKGLDQKVSVSVLDSGSALKVVLASDGASPRGVQSSANKAITALAFNAPSSKVADLAKTDSVIAGKLAANPNFNTHAGAVLIKVGNDVIGAIGVGGAKGSEKDEACAIAGLEKVQNKLS